MSVMWFIDGVFHSDESKLPKAYQAREVRGSTSTTDSRICLSKVMTTSLLTAEDKDGCEEALDALDEEDFHHLPVTAENGALIGVVSDRDLLSHPESNVGEVMTKRVLTATPDTELQSAALAMTEEKVHCLVVINEEQTPVGILTSYDVLSYLVNHPKYELWCD